MKEDITDCIEHCPVCGRYYTAEDVECNCAELEATEAIRLEGLDWGIDETSDA